MIVGMLRVFLNFYIVPDSRKSLVVFENRLCFLLMNYNSIYNFLVPENQWDMLADYLKTTSEQMEEYYEQIGREKSTQDEGKVSDSAEVT